MLKKISRELYNLEHYKFKEFMFAKIRKQQLQSYSFHSLDRPQPLMSRCGEIRKKNVKIVNSSNDDKGCGWAGGDGMLKDLNFSTFEWYVTKKVPVCEMAS